MTSIIEQYEQESQRVTTSAALKPTTSSVLQLDEDEIPMFQKQKVNFDPTDRITHLAVSNDYIVLAMSNNVLLRFDLKKQKNQETISEIELNRVVPGVKLTGLFLDQTADHLLVSFSTELLYLNRKFSKPKPVSKVRGHEITAIGWHATAGVPGDSTTKPILLGTSRGIIFEVEINADDGLFSSSIELYCKQVFDIGKGAAHAITGLEYHRVGKTETYFVVATTVDRLYHFIGHSSNSEERPLLQNLFNKYLGLQEAFQGIPSTSVSCLRLYTPMPKYTPTSLGWLTDNGIFYGLVEPNKEDKLLSGTKMYNLPPSQSRPLTFLITEFHILLLYHDHITGISTLSEQSIFDDYFSETYGNLVNITKDPLKSTLWVYAEKAIFKYKVNNEDRHVWQIYADQGDYELAKKYCKDDPIRKDKVLILQAESFFNSKQYEESALYYAETQSSLEEVALKFLEVENDKALKIFLKKKLSRLRSTDKAQRTMLVLWVLELLLNQLGDLRTNGKTNTSIYNQAQEELDSFLVQPYTLECIRSNKQAVYDLMASHGDESNIVKLTKSSRDYEKVVSHFINKGEFQEALEVLRDQTNSELWYMFAPVLVEDEPRDTLAAFRSMGKNLNPVRLLPALIAAANRTNSDEIIKYLEFCTNELNCQDQPVHNFLLYLLAQIRPDRLMTYLALQGEEPSMVNYDIKYGVRVCKQYNRREACVQLLALLGLWESAVDLALTVNVQLAVQTVLLPHCNSTPHLSRKLWLKIAQHVVEQQNDIAQAMKFLEQCDLIKIEDILPFFPDFTTIDHFKDAICASLQEYNQHIEDLKEEMEDATKSAEIIRNEILAFRSKYTIIQSTDVCCICDIQLLLRPFYAFPCGHRFHSDCLIPELTPLLPQDERESLLQLLVKQNDSQISLTDKDKVKSELDSIVAAQCFYCGDLMIELIDKPFIADEDYDRIRKEWE